MNDQQQFLEKQLESHKKKYSDAEDNYNTIGDRRYLSTMKRQEKFIKAFESALEVENGHQESLDVGNAEYKRKFKNLLVQCEHIAIYGKTGDISNREIMNLLRGEAERLSR